ncbi:MAG: aldehyde dehydrogenase family protein [Leptospiraceae bacterium]|nr:aldehyde dehydrogenase family protein [Leptospiraceae bacterium]MCB1305207.1 aldehyde dehydrogenase family protein [Leptospiraceae bacterium]
MQTTQSPAIPEMANGNRRTIPNYNPATMEVIDHVPVFTAAEVDALVKRARKASKDWAALSLKERSRYLKRLQKVIVKRKDEIVHTICEETGKTEMDGILEVFTVCEHLNFTAKKGPSVLKPQKRSTGVFLNKAAYTNFQPLGVVGVISPWNYPFILTAGPVVQALMAGNTVVVKPSEVTPATTLKLRELATEAGIPEDVLLVATGDGPTGGAIVEHPDTDLICFTGSTATGRKIGEICGRMLKPAILELGGKDPMVVFADANLERAANAAIWGGYSNSGQTCISVERVLVEDKIHDKFVQIVADRLKEMKQGMRHEHPSLGSMTFEKQVHIVTEHLEEARQKGANHIMEGGRHGDFQGLFMKPAIVTEVTSEMKIWKEETFGPVIAVQRFQSEDEAINLANGTTYGLNASVWTKNKKKAKRVARSIHSGAICINDVEANYIMSHLPFGGVKESGIGRVHGLEGLRSFTNMQAVLRDRFGMKKELWWFPYSESRLKLFRRVINILFG